MTVPGAGLRDLAARTAGNPWVRGVAGTAGTRLVVLVLGLGSTIALAHGLGPTGRGVYALAMTFATLGVVALNLGFHTVNTYFASREPETLPTLISNTFALAAAVGAAGALLLGVSRVLGFETRSPAVRPGRPRGRLAADRAGVHPAPAAAARPGADSVGSTWSRPAGS